jgi:uncharacterized protein YukE
MSGAKQPSPLVSFAYDWVGGDIHGLSALAGTLYGYLPEIVDVATALDTGVARLDQDAGWTGSAAEAFETAWDTDSALLMAFSIALEQIGDVVNGLAVALAAIEHALEDAADEFRAVGVPVPETGTPPAVSEPGSVTPGSAQAQQVADANGYAAAYNLAMGEALEARNQASAELQALYTQITPPPSKAGSPADGSDYGLEPGEKLSIADILRAAWVAPTALVEVEEKSVGEAESEEAKAVKAYKLAKKAYMSNFAEQTTEDVRELDRLGDAIGTARTELSGAEKQLEGVEQIQKDFVGSKALDTSIEELMTTLTKSAGEAGAEAGSSILSRIIDIGEDIPVLDVGVAVAGTVLDSITDVDHGKPWYEAVPEDLLANVAGVATGLAMVGGFAVLGAAATAGSIPAAGVAVVCVGAVMASVAAVGVTSEIENLFSENWSQDIHKSGVLAGTLDGVGHSLTNTGRQLKHDAESLVHDVTSIF